MGMGKVIAGQQWVWGVVIAGQQWVWVRLL